MDDAQERMIITYRDKGCSYKTIADILKIPVNTVKSCCRRNQHKKSEPPQNPVTPDKDHCLNCGCEIVIIKGHRPKKFCSDQCRMAWWNSHKDNVNKKAVYSLVCKYCGAAFEAYGAKNRKYCSRRCYYMGRYGKAAGYE